MIVYHPAFDLYHCVYRILQLLIKLNEEDYIEVDRLRIWDFYLLFPDKIHSIKLKQTEKDIRDLMSRFIPKKQNPYEILIDERKMFEKIRIYQFTAIKCLASYGIINKDFLADNRVKAVSLDKVRKYLAKLEPLSNSQQNLVNLLTTHFYKMPMYGPNGLKSRTQLLESKYDA